MANKIQFRRGLRKLLPTLSFAERHTQVIQTSFLSAQGKGNVI